MKLQQLPRPSSTYVRVKCRDCGAETLIYSHAASVIKCKVCGAVLAQPTGGKARILGEIVKEPSPST
ncbi:MAG: 30S ribosomal protein S27e [Thermoprotei archaeon]